MVFGGLGYSDITIFRGGGFPLDPCNLPQDYGPVVDCAAQHVGLCGVDGDVFYEVHVGRVAASVELPQPIFGARVFENAESAHFIANDDVRGPQPAHIRDLIVPAVGAVYALAVGADPESLSLPFDPHLHKDGIDSLVGL